jgi:hypothetical protein
MARQFITSRRMNKQFRLPIVDSILHHRLLVYYVHVLVTIFHDVLLVLEY